MSQKDEGVEKEVDKTTQDPAPNPEKKPESEAGEDQSKNKESEEGIDYKAELEKAQANLSKAEKKIVDLKTEKKQAKKSEEEEEEQPKEEPDIKAIVQEAVSSEFQTLQISQQSEFIDDTLDKMCKNEDEKELVKFIYQNRITKSGTTKGDIASDLEDAKILANKKTIIQENEELRQVAAAKSSITNGGSGHAVKKPKEGAKPKVTEEDRRVAQKYFGGDLDRYLKSKQPTT